MIAADDLHSLIMDLLLEELKQIDSQEQDKKRSSVWCGMKIQKEFKPAEDILFNLNKSPYASNYLKWQFFQGKYEVDASAEKLLKQLLAQNELFNDASKDINRNKHLQRVWNNYMNRFMGNLRIPLYNKLQHYNFYDTLESLLTRMFYVAMENNDVVKREKLEALEGQDIMDMKWGDRMYKEVLHDDNVDDFEPVQIDEIVEVNSCDFQTVLNRLNTKAEEEKIQILDKMFEIKANKTKKLKDRLEIFNGYIVTSNELSGARTIVKHLKKKLETRRKK